MTAVLEYLWLLSTKTYQLKLAVLNILSIRMENLLKSKIYSFVVW